MMENEVYTFISYFCLGSLYIIWCLFCKFIMDVYCDYTEPLISIGLYWFLIVFPIVNIYVIIMNIKKIINFIKENNENRLKDMSD